MVFSFLKSLVTPTSKSGIKRKQRIIGRLARREMQLEEELEVAYKPADQLKIERQLTDLRNQQTAHAFQIMNGINSQFEMLKRELGGFQKETLKIADEIDEVDMKLEKLRKNVDPKQALHPDRIKTLIGLALTSNRKEALEGAGRSVKSSAAAEKIINDDVSHLTNALREFGQARHSLEDLNGNLTLQIRKFDRIENLVRNIMEELAQLGHDFIPKVAAVSQHLAKQRERHRKDPMSGFGAARKVG